MGIPNVMNTGRSAMMTNKAAIATTGHNIANANTEGYSRQRVEIEAIAPTSPRGGRGQMGMGAKVSRVDRINDEYLEKQIRSATKDVAHYEEKEVVLKQAEDVFNEMGGEGLNRLMAKFFNEFRKLSNEPDSEAVRQAVRESSKSLVNDFRRIRAEVENLRKHIDSRIEGNVTELNSLGRDLRELNMRIQTAELDGSKANDLRDQRDKVAKKISTMMDTSIHPDTYGAYSVDIKNVGPFVTGPEVEVFSVNRTPADGQGKQENAFEIKTTSSANGNVTHAITGGKIGALLEARDKTLSTVLSRLDELAFGLHDAINAIHEQGFTRNNATGIGFFNNLDSKERAAEFIDLSDAVKMNSNNIAAAGQPDAPGDNRVALALSSLQGVRFLNGGRTTADDFFNSMVADVGVASAKTKSALNQNKDILEQMNKMRDQISGVSIDEETANLIQFQHAFDASAKVIKVADECLQTVLELKR